ncbi:MAG: hypothetical protein N2383_13855 [Caldilineales bacterium]|nr:hypothetical protein [Caldilineales bacterium]
MTQTDNSKNEQRRLEENTITRLLRAGWRKQPKIRWKIANSAIF